MKGVPGYVKTERKFCMSDFDYEITMVFDNHPNFKSFMESDFYEEEALPALAEASSIFTEAPHRQSFVYADTVEDL